MDDNQRAVVDALRGVGASVLHLHSVGMGCPDIAVGFRGVNHLIEIKDGAKKPSEQRLTPMQKRWHDTWAGKAHVVNSPEGALAVIGITGDGICRHSTGR